MSFFAYDSEIGRRWVDLAKAIVVDELIDRDARPELVLSMAGGGAVSIRGDAVAGARLILDRLAGEGGAP